ncbi:MAG: hypothetical protein KC636_38700 [Myxococcales bacterium]|nr:hypothetical protein [Myxococcales bacterium]
MDDVNAREDEWCAAASAACNEPIAGSATEDTEVWIALEYDGPWGRKALVTSELPASVKEHLRGLEANVPRSRVQLIRRPRTDARGTIRLYIAHAREHAPLLYRFELDAHEAVRALDVAAVIAGDPRFADARSDDAPLLVCTHGQRDRCCAVLGIPVFEQLEVLAPGRAWHTSHVGGHRFAANVVALPSGLCFGRLQVGELPAFLAGLDGGEIFALDRLRGRSCHPKEAQIGESLVRARLGERAIEALTLASCTRAPDEARAYVVRFRDRTGALHDAQFVIESAPPLRPKGCGEELTPISWHRPR